MSVIKAGFLKNSLHGTDPIFSMLLSEWAFCACRYSSGSVGTCRFVSASSGLLQDTNVANTKNIPNMFNLLFILFYCLLMSPSFYSSLVLCSCFCLRIFNDNLPILRLQFVCAFCSCSWLLSHFFMQKLKDNKQHWNEQYTEDDSTKHSSGRSYTYRMIPLSRRTDGTHHWNHTY